MCVIFFYVNSNPLPGGYKLILASNRDEFFARDTLKANKWEKADHCYGGLDMEHGREGGTWLAISSLNGIIKVGALLNLTGEPRPHNAVAENILHETNMQINHQPQENYNQENNEHLDLNKLKENTQNSTNHPKLHALHLLGRGMIVADFVKSFEKDFSIENYNENLVHDCTKYSAFNFVSIEIGSSDQPGRISLCSNVPPSLTIYDEGQCYGFGNSLPQVPFLKVQQGTLRFEQIVKNFLEAQDINDDETAPPAASVSPPENESKENTQNFLVEQLMNLLKCKEKFWPDPELKRRAPNWGQYLSALNVNVPKEDYGSRTHTVILVDSENKMHFYEETMESLDPNGEWTKSYIEKQFVKEP